MAAVKGQARAAKKADAEARKARIGEIRARLSELGDPRAKVVEVHQAWAKLRRELADLTAEMEKKIGLAGETHATLQEAAQWELEEKRLLEVELAKLSAEPDGATAEDAAVPGGED